MLRMLRMINGPGKGLLYGILYSDGIRYREPKSLQLVTALYYIHRILLVCLQPLSLSP